MTAAVGPLYLSMSKVRVWAEGLEYNAESEVSLMHTLTIIVRFHVEPMNNIKVTATCISRNSKS